MRRHALERILAFLGLAVAAYLTVIHFQAVPLACPSQGVVDCAHVLDSPYASIGPVPVAAFGLVWFAVVLVLTSPDGGPRRRGLLRLWAWGGGLAVVYLVYTELFQIGSICLWCSGVHLIVLTLLALTEWRVAHAERS